MKQNDRGSANHFNARNAVFLTMSLGLLLVGTPAFSAQGGSDSLDIDQDGFEQNVQVWFGGVDTDDDWNRNDPLDDSELSGEFGTLPYLGGGSQRLWGNRLQLGYEGGGLVAWKNDSTRFFGNNGGLRIEIDNTLFSMEVFMGGVLSIRPVRWLRFYGGLGPALAYGYLSDDDDEDESSSTSSVSGNFGSDSHAFSLTLYGRAGFEFETAGGFSFGGHARYANHEFDFDDGGELELDSVQYFVSFGQRL
jgi:hypothetical protein